jgi:hypothetical protein
VTVVPVNADHPAATWVVVTASGVDAPVMATYPPAVSVAVVVSGVVGCPALPVLVLVVVATSPVDAPA